MTKPKAISHGARARMEHFWLCGTCSESYMLEQVQDRTVRIITRLKPTTAPSALLLNEAQQIKACITIMIIACAILCVAHRHSLPAIFARKI
jgi:hypothetical protein